MSKVIGIDLGTTNSCVAVMEGGEPVVIPNAEGARTTPSIVAINKSGERLVGEVAKRQAITNPENTVLSIKRFMGRKYEDIDVDRDKRLMPYKVVRAKNGDAWVEIQGKTYSPSEISAMILQKLKTDAEAYLGFGERVMQAVITVPAHFNEAQRQATKDAGQIAGLEVLRIINEPTAASLSYGLGKKKDEKIAVYSFGGGTFDLSVLELGDGVFEVRSTNGDAHLGGDDFDQRVINWLADEFRKEQGIDLRSDRMALQRLKEAAEKAKKELSSSIDLPYITADISGQKHLKVTLTRSKLEHLTEDLIVRSRGPVAEALSAAYLKVNEINEVVLVGGQTRMPAIQKMVKSIFEREPNRGLNPDEAVAIGAAIQAGILTGEVRDVLLLDVTPLSLGIETPEGVITKLIERNTTIPTQKSQVFSTTSDNQPSFEINVLQGERDFAKDNLSLGTFILDGIPPAPRGVPQIEVTFDIDGNGTLDVSARDKGTGREQKRTIIASSGLSKEQIDKMVRDAEAHAAEDKYRKEEVEARNLANAASYRAEKSITELGDKITYEQKIDLESKVVDVLSALSADDVSRIKSAREALDQALYKIAEQIYSKEAQYQDVPDENLFDTDYQQGNIVLPPRYEQAEEVPFQDSIGYIVGNNVDIPQGMQILDTMRSSLEDTVSPDSTRRSFANDANPFRSAYENMFRTNNPNKNIISKYTNANIQEKSDMKGSASSENISTIYRIPRIFISHSHADNDFCTGLVQDLRAALGDESAVWYDTQGGLRGGDMWWQKILKELSTRDVFVVVLSPEAMSSRWVNREIDIAVNKDMLIIPLLYRNCSVRLDLGTIQQISFLTLKTYDAAFEELLIALEVPLDDKMHKTESVLGDPKAVLVQDMMPKIETAFAKKDWYDVLRKVSYLVKQASGFVTAAIYRMQALALSEIGDKLLALDALDVALALVSDESLRLTLLEDYATILSSLNRWTDLIIIVREALQLAPNSVRWLEFQEQVHSHLG